MEKKFAHNLSKALSFTLERKKIKGGFGATPKLPATLEDTFHALRILDAVERYCGLSNDVKFDENLHSDFLLRFIEKRPNLGMKGAFQLIWCMKRCSLSTKAQKLAKEHYLASRPQSTEGLYYALNISKLLDLTLPFRYSREELSKIVTFKGILFRRWMAAFVDYTLKSGLINQKAAAKWIRRCQNYDGGFGFLPGSTSYLENTHFGLHALVFMKEPPIDMENATGFVLGCQTKSGGFSRKADAAPFLDATWHGVATLILLARANLY